jgi:hypothetical protein
MYPEVMAIREALFLSIKYTLKFIIFMEIYQEPTGAM